jgi:hypothetical protein
VKPLKVWSVAMTLAMLTGCASMRQNPSLCRAVSIGTGSLLGATLGGTLSGIVADYPNDWAAKKNWTIGVSTGGGAVAGGLIGWGISRAVCEEPLPPPAPPAPYIPPPPPPPPPTQRRGG